MIISFGSLPRLVPPSFTPMPDSLKDLSGIDVHDKKNEYKYGDAT